MSGAMENKLKRDLDICRGCDMFDEYGKIYDFDSKGYMVNSCGRKFIPPFHQREVMFMTCHCDEGTTISFMNHRENWEKKIVPDNCHFLAEQKVAGWNKEGNDI